MKKLLSSLIISGLVLCGSSVYAEMGCKINGDSTKCGPFTNIDFKTQTGSDTSTINGMTKSIPVLSSTMFATGVANGGATSVASTTAALPVGFAFVRKVIPSNSDPAFTAGTLANGTPGQILTVYVAGLSPSGATTGGSYTITPTTSTGFTSVKLSAVNDAVVFHYIDAATGWVLISWDPGAASSITINLKN